MTRAAALSLGQDLARFAEKNQLTAREREIMGLLVRGHDSVPRIAETLGLSRNTVHNHFKNIFRRTRCNSKTGLLAQFISGVAVRRIRPVVATPRVLLLEPREEYAAPLVETLNRLGMRVYVETSSPRVIDRVRDLRIHAVVAEGEAAYDDGPVALLREIYGDHPAIFQAVPPTPRDESIAVSTGAFELPRELDSLALSIYHHCNQTSYGRARARRVTTTTVSVRIDGEQLGAVSNLSTGGAFIESPQGRGRSVPAPPLGSELTLSLALGDGDALETRAQVVWSQQDPSPGVGVRFTGLSGHALDTLRDAIARVA